MIEKFRQEEIVTERDSCPFCGALKKQDGSTLEFVSTPTISQHQCKKCKRAFKEFVAKVIVQEVPYYNGKK